MRLFLTCALPACAAEARGELYQVGSTGVGYQLASPLGSGGGGAYDHLREPRTSPSSFSAGAGIGRQRYEQIRSERVSPSSFTAGSSSGGASGSGGGAGGGGRPRNQSANDGFGNTVPLPRPFEDQRFDHRIPSGASERLHRRAPSADATNAHRHSLSGLILTQVGGAGWQCSGGEGGRKGRRKGDSEREERN